MNDHVVLGQKTHPSSNEMKCPAQIRIGTRASLLAVAQAEEVKRRLLQTFPEQLNEDSIHIVKIITTGDKIQDRSLSEIGGKGLFTKEIEEGLFSGEIDIAVHSMKDMTDTLPDGLCIGSILEREDPRDAFISPTCDSIKNLPEGAVVGTSSIRRKVQLLNARPDLKVVSFRGNIHTRLEKLNRGDVDATFLAVAGLKRIGLEEHIAEAVGTHVMLPAVAQGAIGIEYLEKNEHIHSIFQVINHVPSQIRVNSERAFLHALGGSCSTPIGGLAEYTSDGKLYFRGMVGNPENPSESHYMEEVGSPDDAVAIGASVGEKMLKKAGHLLG